MKEFNFNNYTVDQIFEAVISTSKVEKKRMIKPNRKRELVYFRFIFFYILRNRLTLKEAGYYFRKDHATVLHGIRTIENFVFQKDELVMRMINSIKLKLMQQTGFFHSIRFNAFNMSEDSFYYWIEKTLYTI